MGRLALLVVALGATLVAFAGSARAQSDEGGIGIRLVDIPVDRAEDPRALVYVIDHLQPGSVIERHIEISNTTAAAHSVDLYAGASRIEDGRWNPLAGRQTNDLTTWTSIEPPTVRMAPGETSRVRVTVEVPVDARSGEQYAVVWAEAPPATHGGVTVVNRVGVRMYLAVAAGGEPRTDFDIDQVTVGDDGSTLLAAVTNTGERAIDLTGEARLDQGPGGARAGPFAARLGTTLAPGMAAVVEVPLPDDLPVGSWTAHVTLASGSTTRDATAEVALGGAGSAAHAGGAAAGTGRDRTVPIVLAVLAILAVLAAAVRTERRVSRRRVATA